ncbi:MAG: DUF4418 family protein [Clostridiales Family XIII bacterium]|nr:DUF4418 family protein [Clostridiales Family XIII bacterium]
MKNRVFTGIGAIILGLLVSLGPQYLFRLCAPLADGSFMRCHWTGQAEIGLGALIALLGLGLALSPSAEVRLGLSVAAILACAVVILMPNTLIGGCGMRSMACRAVTFPALTVAGTLGMIGFAVNALYLYRGQRRKAALQ